ncbi:hypothetical protein RJ43_12385 [Alteromonas macleodii]|jgi:hypothetical protein|nr:hypothetical protein RJ43_12385 [Alteromonas macleodii]|tara:strand:- start:79 stop:318 length:240 start_codon:yes stop_codon:yes gene_type:complete
MYIAPATITANITISGISEEKLSQNSWKLITDSGLLLCKLELADETDKCRYCAAEDKDLNVIHSLLFGMPLILIIANSL